MNGQVYRARNPQASPLWQCLTRHFDEFLDVYEEQFQPQFGYLRPIIPEVVNKFFDCGTCIMGSPACVATTANTNTCSLFPASSFALRATAGQEGRWFCPSCHLPAPKRLRQAGQKKVQLFGELLTETILYPVPHRHFTLALPKMLRVYFKYDRDLLKDLCRMANECLRDYLRVALDLPEGIVGAVMTIHTFGEYLDFHPHLHVLVADGLFTASRLFHIMPDVPIKPLEELFRVRVLSFLVGKGLLSKERADMLMSWKHSGFNVHRSRRVEADERDDLVRLAQYIIRNPFSVEKMHLGPDLSACGHAQAGGMIVYRSGMNPKVNANFRIFTPLDFIAAITSHIPDKSFQLVRYYGWYSNKMRGQRDKLAAEEAEKLDETAAPSNVIDISDHKPRRIPSKKWRELIKIPRDR